MGEAPRDGAALSASSPRVARRPRVPHCDCAGNLIPAMIHPFLWGVATSVLPDRGRAGERLDRVGAPGAAPGPRASAAARRPGTASRWRSDFALLPTLGANAYRFSIERSAIEPEPGVFSDEALRARARARGRARAPRDRAGRHAPPLHAPALVLGRGRLGEPGERRGISPVRRGVVADALGPRVRIWVTLNEPIVFLLGGYLAGLIPPGPKSFRRGRAGARAPCSAPTSRPPT